MTTNPTFELSFSPPVEWTTKGTKDSTSTEAGKQAVSLEEATKRAQDAIRLNVMLKFYFCIIIQFF